MFALLLAHLYAISPLPQQLAESQRLQRETVLLNVVCSLLSLHKIRFPFGKDALEPRLAERESVVRVKLCTQMRSVPSVEPQKGDS
jgi:hypothetical protein